MSRPRSSSGPIVAGQDGGGCAAGEFADRQPVQAKPRHVVGFVRIVDEFLQLVQRRGHGLADPGRDLPHRGAGPGRHHRRERPIGSPTSRSSRCFPPGITPIGLGWVMVCFAVIAVRAMGVRLPVADRDEGAVGGGVGLRLRAAELLSDPGARLKQRPARGQRLIRKDHSSTVNTLPRGHDSRRAEPRMATHQGWLVWATGLGACRVAAASEGRPGQGRRGTPQCL
jgi:hypothetical protein